MEILNSIMTFFVSSAHADPVAAAAPQQQGGYSMMIMLAVFVLFMYFAMWRPQSKRAKAHRDLLSSLATGDEVVTAGGILGKIAKVSDNYTVLSLADNVQITIQKSSIVNVLPKGTLKSI